MTNLDCILKSRDITLLTKVHTVKAMIFPVVMYGCESWPIKKAEHRRIDAFELWCLRRLLRVPWNRSILKEISPEYSSERPILKLKLQYFGHQRWEEQTHWKRPWFWERLKAEEGGDKKRWLDGITDSRVEFEQALGVGNGQGSLTCYSPWGCKELDTTKRLHWTELIALSC